MDPARWSQVRSAFEEIVELSPAERAARLAAIAEQDRGLHDEVLELLAADADATTDRWSRGAPPVVEESPGPSVGRLLGRYRLLRVLGTGGMGRVYEAEQDEPRRRVALKTLRYGLAGNTELRRFRWECEVLGRLHHPGIAQIYEAGTFTGDSGEEQPYFAMEFVEGANTILQHVRQKDLSVPARLGLFRQLCQAVAHGHAHGVLHRDLKPANVLVDGEGHLKVIDFGIARTLDQDAAQTLTETGHLVGTLHYMAPEQLEGSDVDVRVDVYALGVILHELLSGRLPRVVGEASLPRALIQLSETAPARLREHAPELSRELEWIVGKALAADRERRYESPLALADDITRYLAHEPISAGPESLSYRISKFVRRHRLAVSAAVLVFVSLVGAIVGIGLSLDHAQQQYQLAEERLVAVQEEQRTTAGALSHFIRTLTAVDPRRNGREAKLIDALLHGADRIDVDFPNDPAVRERLHHAVGTILSALDFPEQSERHLSAARDLGIELYGETGVILEGRLGPLTLTWLRLGRLEEAEELATRIWTVCQRELGSRHPATANALEDYAAVLRRRGRLAEAEEAYRDSMQTFQGLGESGAAERRVAQNGLAATLIDSGRSGEALPMLESLVGELEVESGDTNRQLLSAVLNNLAVCLLEDDRPEQAEKTLIVGWELASAALGERHPESMRIRFNLGKALLAQGREGEAVRSFEQVVAAGEGAPTIESLQAAATLARRTSARGDGAAAIRQIDDAILGFERLVGAHHRHTLFAKMLRATFVLESGDVRAAIRSLEEVRDASIARLGDEDVLTLMTESNLGVAHLRVGEIGQAEALHRHVYEVRRGTLGEEHDDTLQSMNNLAAAVQDLGRSEEAERLYTELIALRDRRGESEAEITQIARNNLATMLSARGDLAAAEAVYRQLYETRRRVLGEADPKTIRVLNNLAVMRQRQEDLGGAAELYARVLEGAIPENGVSPLGRANYAFNAAVCFESLERFEQAEHLMLESFRVLKAQRGLEDEITRDAILVLRRIYAAWSRPDREEAFERELGTVD
ncbi:MAG: serine/threonine-protein kinase [Planctomycetota bacterium]